ncbi:MAG: hypothetical protein ABFS24_02695 [Pseudomonadota bacterium]
MSATERALQDNRGQKRIEVSEVIRAMDRHTGHNIGQLANINKNGLMLLSPEPVSKNSIFQLSLEFEAGSGSAADSPLMIGVESLWSNSSSDRSQHWVGFYIIDVSDQDLERIRKLAW